MLPDIDPGPEDKSWEGADPGLWAERLRDALAEGSPKSVASPNRRCAPVPPIPSCCCSRRSGPWP